MRRVISSLFLAWFALVSFPVHAADPVEQVTIKPEQSDEILSNPGMGWQTFHRTAEQDKNLPSWIPSTVHYARWGWGTLEPEGVRRL